MLTNKNIYTKDKLTAGYTCRPNLNGDNIDGLGLVLLLKQIGVPPRLRLAAAGRIAAEDQARLLPLITSCPTLVFFINSLSSKARDVCAEVSLLFFFSLYTFALIFFYFRRNFMRKGNKEKNRMILISLPSVIFIAKRQVTRIISYRYTERKRVYLRLRASCKSSTSSRCSLSSSKLSSRLSLVLSLLSKLPR